MTGHGPKPPNTPTEWRLHDTIKTSLAAALLDNPSDPDLINVTDAVYRAVEAFLDEAAPSVADHTRGPSLVYIHADGRAITAVDRGTVPPGRDHAIAGALISEAHRLHNESSNQ